MRSLLASQPSERTIHIPRVDPTIEHILADPVNYYNKTRQKDSIWSILRLLFC
jgi:hypothetical protein